MSSSSEDEGTDSFKFKDCVQISNKQLKLRAMIQPKFRKSINGQVFTKLDFYQSRGIRSLLACKLSATSKQIRGGHGKGKINKFCKSLRKMRDKSFREQVVLASGQRLKFQGTTMPRNRHLKTLAIARQSVTFSMPVVPGVADECVFSCAIPDNRVNGNSELWIELTGPVCEYMSKVIASYDDEVDADNEDNDADGDAEGDDDHETDVHNESRENEPAPSTPKPEQVEEIVDEGANARDVPTVEPESAVKVTSTELKSKVQKSLKTFFQSVSSG